MTLQSLGHFASVQEAWHAANKTLLVSGDWVDSVRDERSIGSSFGTGERPFRELIGTSFVVENPRDRVILSEARPLNLPFLLANFLWTLSGSNRLEMIASYNKRGACFSDDGVTLASAFGPKIFGARQFEQVADLLTRDPSSRRAAISLFDGQALANNSRDVSCALALQFFVRDDAVDCVTFMRSQSSAMVLPYDLFLFTMIHEAMAARINRPLGRYMHICASLHYYRDEQNVVERIALESNKGPMEAMPPMPRFEDGERAALVAAEERVRKAVVRSTGVEAEELGRYLKRAEIKPYWKFVFEAFFVRSVQVRSHEQLRRAVAS